MTLSASGQQRFVARVTADCTSCRKGLTASEFVAMFSPASDNIATPFANSRPVKSILRSSDKTLLASTCFRLPGFSHCSQNEHPFRATQFWASIDPNACFSTPTIAEFSCASELVFRDAGTPLSSLENTFDTTGHSPTVNDPVAV
jgi:hypothetical protein